MQSHVSAAKSAIDSLSASISIEHGPFGVRSNVVAPGAISGTEGIERLAPPEGSEKRRELEKSVPLGRFGRVRDISDATVWVCGPAAGWVTGAIVVVDGGAWRLGGGAGIGGIK